MSRFVLLVAMSCHARSVEETSIGAQLNHSSIRDELYSLSCLRRLRHPDLNREAQSIAGGLALGSSWFKGHVKLLQPQCK